MGIVTKTASSIGYGGSVHATVSVSEEDQKIVDVHFDGDKETPCKALRAFQLLTEQITNLGKLDIDAVSGATVTSQAAIDAAKKAFNEAIGTNSEAVSPVKMKPGFYTGKAKGYWQIWDLPVTIKVNETSILKIEVPNDRFAHGETEIILDSVVQDMFPRIIENQSIAVDSTTGATLSSSAAKLAIRRALSEALEAGGSSKEAIHHFLQAPTPPITNKPIEKDVDLLVVGLGDGGIIAMRSACETIQQMHPRKNAEGLVSILGIDRAARFGGKSSLAHEGCNNNPPKYSKVVNNGDPLVDSDYFKQAWKTFASTDGRLYAKEDVLNMWFEESGKTVDWLYERGYIFGNLGAPDPMVGGKVKYNVCLKNNTDRGTYEDRRAGKKKYQQLMLDYVVAQGGEYLLNTEGYEFIMDGNRVAGVKARNLVTKQEYIIHCKAVIMNTGGFCSNQEMVNSLLDKQWQGERKTLGTGQDTGALFQAALDIGAGTYNIGMSPISMHCGTDHWLDRWPFHEYDNILEGRTGRMKVWSLNNIPQGIGSLSDCIMLDKTGKRYVNEARFAHFADSIDEDSFPFFRAGNYHWSLVSENILRRIAEEGFNTVSRWDGYRCQGDIPANMPVPELWEGLDYAVEEGMAFKADTLEELAVLIDVCADTLVETVRDYNLQCERGIDEAFGKDAKYMVPLEYGPYYALKMFCFSFGTNGGLDVDNHIRVLRTDGKTPIEGLYATGLDSMGVLLDPHGGYAGFGGVAQGWLWTSGRIAGINAAKYIEDNFGFQKKEFALSKLDSTSVTGWTRC